MHTRLLRPVLLALGALLLSARPAAAQFIELLTEAPVTFQVTLTASSVTSTTTERTTTSTTTRLAHVDVINELRAANIIPASPADGWMLVAVRPAPADLVFIDGAFHLYAVNGNQRIRVPSTKFFADASNSVAKYRERHLGQYVLESSGTVTSHVTYDYAPTIGSLAIGDGTTDGFATIQYRAKSQADGFEIFFCAISSLRATTRGSFIANSGQGLMTINVTVGAAKLVPASNYPDVDYFYPTNFSAN
jgi:hypothetical protein